MKHKTLKKWLLKVRKDGIRKRFLQWEIPIILPHHHLSRNGGGRKKKEKPIEADYKLGVRNEQSP